MDSSKRSFTFSIHPVHFINKWKTIKYLIHIVVWQNQYNIVSKPQIKINKFILKIFKSVKRHEHSANLKRNYKIKTS